MSLSAVLLFCSAGFFPTQQSGKSLKYRLNPSLCLTKSRLRWSHPCCLLGVNRWAALADKCHTKCKYSALFLWLFWPFVLCPSALTEHTVSLVDDDDSVSLGCVFIYFLLQEAVRSAHRCSWIAVFYLEDFRQSASSAVSRYFSLCKILLLVFRLGSKNWETRRLIGMFGWMIGALTGI